MSKWNKYRTEVKKVNWERRATSPEICSFDNLFKKLVFNGAAITVSAWLFPQWLYIKTTSTLTRAIVCMTVALVFLELILEGIILINVSWARAFAGKTGGMIAFVICMASDVMCYPIALWATSFLIPGFAVHGIFIYLITALLYYPYSVAVS